MRIKSFSILATISAMLVAFLYLTTVDSPYAKWTPNVVLLLWGLAFFTVTTLYVLGRVAWVFFRGNRTAMTCVFVLFATVAVGATCWDTYQKDAINAYNELDSCITGTNNDPWYTRLAIRTICNAKYVSDAEQAAFDYSACMGFGGLASLAK